jgi:hypothetical protein
MSQAAFLFDAPAAPAAARAARHAPAHRRHPLQGVDEAGFEIGWDFARHRLTPPVAHLHADNPVRQGWSAARVAFGHRTLRPTLAVRQWLELRLAAWQRGRAFENVQVTPHFIAQLQVPTCPVTGSALAGGDALAQSAHPPLPARLNQHAACAAGNLAMLSDTARAAAEGLDWRQALQQAEQAEAAGEATRRGLTPQQWRRLGGLMSLATPLDHAHAAALPLLVLPPNRVRVLNPVQALQVMLTLQFCQAGYARRLVALAALMPSSELRHAFQVFMHTLLARRLAAGSAIDAPAMRAAMEQAWAAPGHAPDGGGLRTAAAARRAARPDGPQPALAGAGGRRGRLGAGQRRAGAARGGGGSVGDVGHRGGGVGERDVALSPRSDRAAAARGQPAQPRLAVGGQLLHAQRRLAAAVVQRRGQAGRHALQRGRRGVDLVDGVVAAQHGRGRPLAVAGHGHGRDQGLHQRIAAQLPRPVPEDVRPAVGAAVQHADQPVAVLEDAVGVGHQAGQRVLAAFALRMQRRRTGGRQQRQQAIDPVGGGIGTVGIEEVHANAHPQQFLFIVPVQHAVGGGGHGVGLLDGFSVTA